MCGCTCLLDGLELIVEPNLCGVEYTLQSGYVTFNKALPEVLALRMLAAAHKQLLHCGFTGRWLTAY